MKLTVEIYEEYPNYYAHIGEDGSSGYLCSGTTPEECAEQIKEYMIETFNRDNYETD